MTLIDFARYLTGRITREELRYRMVRRQSTAKWIRDYDTASRGKR